MSEEGSPDMSNKERCRKCRKSNCLKMPCKFCSDKFCTNCLLPETHKCEFMVVMKTDLIKRHAEKLNQEKCVASKMVKC